MSSYDGYEQLALFTSRPIPQLPFPKHDPYWDEITKKTAPEHIEEKWNPDDFGEVPFKNEADQLTIFYDDSHEPPDPDDFNSIEEFESAWYQWQSVREQITQAFEVAPEHMQLSTDEDINKTAYLLPQNLVNSHTSNNCPSQKQVNHWVERYWVKRANTKHYYYRYCWMSGRKINRVHIGSIGSTIAQRKQEEAKQMISNGKLPEEIINYFKQENTP